MNSLRVCRSITIALTTYLALSCADSSAPHDPLSAGGARSGSGSSTDTTATAGVDTTSTGGGDTTSTATVPVACPDSWTKPTFSSSGKSVKGTRWISSRAPVELSVSGVIG